MKQQLLSIVGTTATGKSDFAFALAQALLETERSKRVHLISADSRQIYVELPILSGADIPDNFTQTSNTDYALPFFQNSEKNILLHGVSMLSATSEWSVALFRDFALRILNLALQRNEVCILVGGTGLYHEHVLQTDPALLVPPDPIWRNEAITLSVASLKELLATVAPQKLDAMNQSDSNNPRRLQRAIEVARATLTPLPQWQVDTIGAYEHAYVGLSVSTQELQQRILQRIQKRLKQGVLEEVQRYVTHFGGEDLQSSSTLGLSELAQHLRGDVQLDVAVERWLLAEFQYAKRQQVWWNKQKAVYWVKPTESPLEVMENITKLTLKL